MSAIACFRQPAFYTAKKVRILGPFSRSITVEMNIKSIRWGLAIPCGWFVILVGAAMFLPSAESRGFVLRTVSLLALIIVWLLLTAVALSLHFYRAWRRLHSVPNKWAYAVWLTFETTCALALVGTLVWLFVPGYVTTPRQAREMQLQHNLITMRAIISQYTLDLQRRPQSLNDFVTAGYIRQMPIDPMTRRNDTWVLEWSNDPKMPGIINIRSGSSATSSKGSAYHDW
jgi:general secretion pathway protein G